MAERHSSQRYDITPEVLEYHKAMKAARRSEVDVVYLPPPVTFTEAEWQAPGLRTEDGAYVERLQILNR